MRRKKQSFPSSNSLVQKKNPIDAACARMDAAFMPWKPNDNERLHLLWPFHSIKSRCRVIDTCIKRRDQFSAQDVETSWSLSSVRLRLVGHATSDRVDVFVQSSRGTELLNPTSRTHQWRWTPWTPRSCPSTPTPL